MCDLGGRTILVTGASKGIGAAIAAAVGAAGGNVVAHYRSDRNGAEDATRSVLRDRKLIVGADLARSDDVRRLWEKALAWRGRVDVLVNNAGAMIMRGGIDAQDDEWDDVWERTLAANVLGPARLTRDAVRHFREVGGGVIITISSWAAQRGSNDPDTMAYSASKAAAKAFTQTIALGCARERILAYVIAPGLVRTKMAEDFAAAQPGGEGPITESLAMREWTPASEIADLTVFLATGKARHLSGATLDVNGASYIR
ncbi:MAG: SDR family oxidoreductase [Bauldia sp.]|uniref:SDR family NAD(P)-dependent oxidoreductase n=1 Tax=Bauldia sp. TaxID=2575872 RepID=UPI001D48DADA|nr:SDR family oxidoreductase [Bauldia sp.]MCB1497516.1 SDR family oxidoreductase [Bauldia sp.]